MVCVGWGVFIPGLFELGPRRGHIIFRGGGGTDLRPALDLAAKCCGAVICITDCCTPWPSVPPRRSTVIVRLGDVPCTWAGAREIKVKN